MLLQKLATCSLFVSQCTAQTLLAARQTNRFLSFWPQSDALASYFRQNICKLVTQLLLASPHKMLLVCALFCATHKPANSIAYLSCHGSWNVLFLVHKIVFFIFLLTKHIFLQSKSITVTKLTQLWVMSLSKVYDLKAQN